MSILAYLALVVNAYFYQCSLLALWPHQMNLLESLARRYACDTTFLEHTFHRSSSFQNNICDCGLPVIDRTTHTLRNPFLTFSYKCRRPNRTYSLSDTSVSIVWFCLYCSLATLLPVWQYTPYILFSYDYQFE